MHDIRRWTPLICNVRISSIGDVSVTDIVLAKAAATPGTMEGGICKKDDDDKKDVEDEEDEGVVVEYSLDDEVFVANSSFLNDSYETI